MTLIGKNLDIWGSGHRKNKSPLISAVTLIENSCPGGKE
jgi:hypothetical protein